MPCDTESHVSFHQQHHTFVWFLDKTDYIGQTEIE